MNSKYIFLISVAVFMILLFVIPSSFISTELGNTILTVVAFLFGILAGFYIVVTTTDYNSVKSILATETAGWISLHQCVLIYDKKIADRLASLIDEYILRAFDFEIIDYAKTTHNEFESIKELVRELPAKEDLSTVYEKILNVMDDIVISRQQLTVLGARTLSIFQWTILFSLASIFVFSLYGLRTGEFFFDVVTVVISSSIVLVLLLIRDLDLYIWNERTFSYDIFENVFRSIGRLPYYPSESILKKRVQPQEKEYRVGVYVNYPKSIDRNIEIRKNG